MILTCNSSSMPKIQRFVFFMVSHNSCMLLSCVLNFSIFFACVVYFFQLNFNLMFVRLSIRFVVCFLSFPVVYSFQLEFSLLFFTEFGLLLISICHVSFLSITQAFIATSFKITELFVHFFFNLFKFLMKLTILLNFYILGFI